MHRSHMSRCLCCLLALVACIAPASTAADDPASAVAPFVDEQTLMVARVDLYQFVLPLLSVAAGQPNGSPVLADDVNAWTGAGGGAVYAVVTLADPWPAPVFLVAPLEAEHDAEVVHALWRRVHQGDMFRLEIIRGAAVVAQPHTLERLRALEPVEAPELRPAFHAVRAAGLQVVVRISDDMRRVIAELMPELPEELGGGPSTLLTEHTQWAAVGFDMLQMNMLKLRIKADGPEAAANLAHAAEAMLASFSDHKGPDAPVPNVEGDMLAVDVGREPFMNWFSGLLLPTLTRTRTAARRLQSMTQMRGLYQGCCFYAAKKQNKHKFPPDLATLVEWEFVSPDYLLSPLAEQSPPQDLDDWPDDKQRRWLNANTSYVLLPGLTDDVDDKRIALIEKLQFSQDRQVLICYQDNHTEALPYDEAQQQIIEQTGKTLEEWSGLSPPKQP